MNIQRILFWMDFNEHIEMCFDSLAGRIRQLLNPTGVSDIAKVAFLQACDLANEFSAELHILYVAHDLSKLAPDVTAQLTEGSPDFREAIARAEQILARTPVPERSKCRAVIRKVCVGQVSHEVGAYVAAQNINLLVVGGHGYTSEKIVRTAGCSVWVVPSMKARAAALTLKRSPKS